MSPQDEAALDGLSAHDPHKQAPLYSLYERSGQMGAGELEQALFPDSHPGMAAVLNAMRVHPSHAKVLEVIGYAGASATGILQGAISVLHPGRSDLLETVILYPVERLGDDRMIRGVTNPVQDLITDVAGVRADGEGDLSALVAPVEGIEDLTDHDIRP